MLFDTWQVARRLFAAVALAASIVVVVVAVVAVTGRGTTRPPTSRADIYTQLARQLKGHLKPLVGALTTTKHAPTIQVPQQQGYSCEVASGTGCSLHPCVKYAESVGEVAATATATAAATATATATATAGGCNSTAKATPRATPITAP